MLHHRRKVLGLCVAPIIFAIAVIVTRTDEAGSRIQAAETKRPNILFIYTDDQPYKTVGCYPESPRWVKTPAIDRLAARGIRFERSYCGSWCMPSRASLLTGRMPYGVESMHMVGKYPGSEYDPSQCPFWPAELRKHGYQTAQIGKWHTGTDTGYGRDWDYQIVWNRPAHPENAGNYYANQLLSINGEERTVPGYSTDNYTQWAVEYIEGQHRAADKPWYLWLCYGAVHGPTTPAERHRGAYAGNAATVPADILGPRSDKPAYLEKTQAWMLGPDGKIVQIRRKQAANNFDSNVAGRSYDAWIQQVNECALAIDEGVARVMSALEKSGQLENTLVVFTADQGYGLGEHGFHQKQAPYDATIAGPLIISQPGTWPEGKVCKEPVNSPDLVALFCTTTGLKLPWKTHGRDITPLLRNPETAKLDIPMVMVHTGHYFGSDTRTIPVGAELTAEADTPWWVLLRDGSYKYIRTLVANEIEELYDLATDPEELHNLAGDPAHVERMTALRAQLAIELQRTEAPFAGNMPPTRPVQPRALPQTNTQSGDVIRQTEKDSDGTEVPYQLYLPQGYDNTKHYPLALCMHGAGDMKSAPYEARTAQSTALLRPENRSRYPAFVLIPQTSTGWVRRPGRDVVKSGVRIAEQPESAPLKLVVKILGDVMRQYRVDPDRVYVGGQSMGGVATWDLIIRHPDLFAAAVPICGVGDTTAADKISCPVWNFHGAKDRTVPVSHSRDMVEAMKAAKKTVKYTEFPEVEHGAWGPAWQEPQLLPWLMAQKRSAQ